MMIHVHISHAYNAVFQIGQDGNTFIDLDSHADTCVLGNNCLIIESPYPEWTATVSFADPFIGTVIKQILSGAFL